MLSFRSIILSLASSHSGTLSLLFFDRMFDRIFRLQLRAKQTQKTRDIHADAFQMLDSLAEGRDLVGDRGPLRFVVSQGNGVCLMSDPVADL